MYSELYDPFDYSISDDLEDGEIKIYNCDCCYSVNDKTYDIINSIHLCLTCYNLYMKHLCSNCNNLSVKLYKINNKEICKFCLDNYTNKIYGRKCTICKIIKRNTDWYKNKHNLICKKCYDNKYKKLSSHII